MGNVRALGLVGVKEILRGRHLASSGRLQRLHRAAAGIPRWEAHAVERNGTLSQGSRLMTLKPLP